ncbi:MAG: 4Fe-4S binding protein [Salinivirgaceae bacterium]|jgi:pyruvate ferredoxin oxidoreductase delta subunit|nr:4Fe-4S binding protein [Salinivirgaceae bacterium]
MNRPTKQNYQRPTHIDDFPVGPQFEAGHLADTNAGWRTFKPVIDHEKCINCLICYLVCPDGTIIKTETKPDVDYDYCKGCGVCAHECPKDAIEMVKEQR